MKLETPVSLKFSVDQVISFPCACLLVGFHLSNGHGEFGVFVRLK